MLLSFIVTLAKERGQTPDDFARQLLKEQVEAAWEAACAPYDALTSSPEWQQMEAEADAELAAGTGEYFENDDSLIKAFEAHR